MSLPDVKINLQNGTLGAVLATNDGIAGMVLTGASEGDIVAGTPFLVASLTDAENQGLTEDGNPFAYKAVKEFYDEAGEGALLYLLLVPDTMTVEDMADKTNADGAVKLLDYGGGKIRLLGVMYDAADDGAITVTDGIDSLCYDAAANMQTLAVAYAAKQVPFRGFIGATGTGFSGGVPDVLSSTDLINQTGSAYPYAAILIGDTAAGGDACLGLLLGRLARVPVQRKASRVKTGPLASVVTAYIGTTPVEEYTTTSVIHDRAFITLRTFPNKNGYFFANDFTCTPTTDDYHFAARGRVIDKASIIAYATYVEEVDEEVPVDDTGKIAAGYAKYLEQKITNQLNLSMTANREVSAVSCFVDPAQNVLATSKVNIVLKVRPVGYASDIEVNLGFDNPAAA